MAMAHGMTRSPGLTPRLPDALRRLPGPPQPVATTQRVKSMNGRIFLDYHAAVGNASWLRLSQSP